MLPLASALGIVIFGVSPAHARMLDPGVSAPSIVDTVRCRIIRERVERGLGPLPGPVEYRGRRVCDPDPVVVREKVVRETEGACIVRRERIERPDGSVVYRKVRRCDDD